LIKKDKYSRGYSSIPPKGLEVYRMKTIVDVAVADGRFKTLVAAVKAAKLDGALSGTGPFTVFAPTDDAFKKLPAGTVETLLKDPEGKLKQILLYHVVSGKNMAADVAKMKSLKTLQGGNLTITASKDGVFVNKAKVIIPDIKPDNGVCHAIDSVLMPP
jgi:uncharacterized surface protein with fasciclin (FAS1) repeats